MTTSPDPMQEQVAAEPQYPAGEVFPPSADTPPQPVRRERFGMLSHAPATHMLVGINIAVFVWMLAHGVSLMSPTQKDLMDYGANNSIAVLSGQWWRLISAMFVHVGALHLATNMWCLWNLGLLGEPLLGFFGMTSVYLLCGAAGNLLSMGWDISHRSFFQVGAGASGAVFGIAGILIVLLSNKKLSEWRNGRPGIPWGELQALRKSVIQFAAINLVIGLSTMFYGPIRIDNSAHLGGFFCGLGLGLPLLPRMTSGREKYLSRQKATFAAFALLLAMFGYFLAKLA